MFKVNKKRHQNEATRKYTPRSFSMEQLLEMHLRSYQTSVKGLSHWIQDVNWAYIKSLENVQDVLWTSYVRSLYVLYPEGFLRKVEILSHN